MDALEQFLGAKEEAAVENFDQSLPKKREDQQKEKTNKQILTTTHLKEIVQSIRHIEGINT